MGACAAKLLLAKCSNDTTPPYTFDNNKYYCKVIDIYDGDSITVAIRFNKIIYKHKVRMYGYDSPELKPRRNIPDRDSIILKAKEARDVLKELILHRIVVISIEKGTWDKYGRLLGTIYTRPTCGCTQSAYTFNVNTYMCDSGYGYAYFGGTKL